jgi:hypothetical protein
MDWIRLVSDSLDSVISWVKTICVRVVALPLSTSIFSDDRDQLSLALLVIGPWLAVLVYDLLLYLWRSTLYEIPYVGGRARGRDKPMAPSLTERPGGDPRKLTIPMPPISDGLIEESNSSGDRNGDSRRRAGRSAQDDVDT